MNTVTTLHPEKLFPVALTGTEWMAVMLKLAGRNPNASHRAALETAEPKMLAQLKMEG